MLSCCPGPAVSSVSGNRELTHFWGWERERGWAWMMIKKKPSIATERCFRKGGHTVMHKRLGRMKNQSLVPSLYPFAALELLQLWDMQSWGDARSNEKWQQMLPSEFCSTSKQMPFCHSLCVSDNCHCHCVKTVRIQDEPRYCNSKVINMVLPRW